MAAFPPPIAEALRVGDEAYEDGRFHDALVAYETAKSKGSEQAAVRATLNIGEAQSALGRHEEALATFDEVLHRVSENPTPAMEVLAAAVLLCRAEELTELGRHEEAISAVKEIVTDFGGIPGMGRAVIRILLHLGTALGDVGRYEEAISAYEEALDREEQEPSTPTTIAS